MTDNAQEIILAAEKLLDDPERPYEFKHYIRSALRVLKTLKTEEVKRVLVRMIAAHIRPYTQLPG